MKVIFLDFDGVINNWVHFEGVDPKNVKCLLEIINETNAKVVATTSNKYGFQRYSDVDLKNTLFYKYVKVLNELGIEIMDVTPYINGNRELEIIEYLKMHPEIEQFLILDDDGVIKSLLEHQVFPELYNGITEEHIKPSIDILNGKLGFYPPDFNFDETFAEMWIKINEYHNSRKR